MEAETLKTNFLLTYKDSDLQTMVLGTSELQAESQGSCTHSGTRNCYSYLWPDVYLWRGWESEDLETAPSVFSHKVPSGEGSSSILVVQQSANRDRNTILSRTPPGKFISSSLTPFLAHFTVSPVCVCVCVSNHL